MRIAKFGTVRINLEAVTYVVDATEGLAWGTSPAPGQAPPSASVTVHFVGGKDLVLGGEDAKGLLKLLDSVPTG